jgi:hypothetical protein
MGYTRRQFVTAAYEEIGLASYVFDLETEALESAGRKLDTMMGEWNGRGIRLGYPLPTNPQDADLDTQTRVPDWANNAVISNLAVLLAPRHGKTVAPQTTAAARSGLDLVLSKCSMPPEVRLGPLPSGAGNKTITNPFLTRPSEPLTAGPDSELTFE